MWDTSVEMIELTMALDCLDDLPAHPLPEQYGCRAYRPGDELHWARIETSAGEFSKVEAGLRRFEGEFPDREPLSERMETNTSTLPREMVFFTACFTASSAKDRARGSFTVQSK